MSRLAMFEVYWPGSFEPKPRCPLNSAGPWRNATSLLTSDNAVPKNNHELRNNQCEPPRGQAPRRFTIASLEVEADTVTESDGRFSATHFHEATGYRPREYILEFVKDQDGHVEQTEIVEIQPWSKSTVTRLLDELEDEG